MAKQQQKKSEETKDNNYDVYFYYGGIYREGYEKLTNLIEEKRKNSKLAKSVIFILVTFGGDPHSGYRIGRALQHYYSDHVNVLIPSYCKSAGTLVTISANQLFIGNRGELGPLDIQLQKEDEIGARNSGLDIFKAINHLQERAINSFNSYVKDIRYSIRISTRLSAEIAEKLTDSVISPIASQIEPMKVGEHQRALEICLEYGVRLANKSKNLINNDVLGKLTMGYPDHGFVIDRCEACKLFKNVKSPNNDYYIKQLDDLAIIKLERANIDLGGAPDVIDLTDVIKDKQAELNKNDESKPITESGNE
ncbi:SDH family Clp fold serine proteinase [Gilliamella sp. Pas-s25]|uniref:SDH family Clp fold serine proteinase n=1 Tax=Gilliamella sp. Pas-s25 TaxID=2687310 RepID=UPI00135D57EC|nr:SppA protein [Gilliamella sp. Pas-s25]MWP62027.1 SppA protein [Gilliamella sp. Pas-s25]